MYFLRFGRECPSLIARSIGSPLPVAAFGAIVLVDGPEVVLRA